MIIAATGHRPDKLNNEWNMDGPASTWVTSQLKLVIDKHKPDKIISGMALGVDILWALIGIELDIPVVAALPFIGQEDTWSTQAQSLYNEILAHPLVTSNILYSGIYASWKLLKRNEYMVDNCDLLVAVWDWSTTSGTGKCVKYAKSVNKTIEYIDTRGRW